MKVWQGKPFMYFCGFSQISAFKSRAKNNIAWKSVEEQDQTGLLNKFLEGFSAFHKINDIKKDQMNQNPGSDFNPWNPLIFLRIHRISLRSKQKIFSLQPTTIWQTFERYRYSLNLPDRITTPVRSRESAWNWRTLCTNRSNIKRITRYSFQAP